MVGIGKKALQTMRRTLIDTLGENAAPPLQAIGYAIGEELYAAFLAWLPGYAAVTDPAELDASALSEVLSAFFREQGWGQLEVERLGTAGVAVSSRDWAEAEPGSGLGYPACFVTAGLLSDFLTRLAGGTTVSTMEVECRGQGDVRCKFVVGSPEVLDAAFAALSAGQSYEPAFQR